jgi:hypothetical protein
MHTTCRSVHCPRPISELKIVLLPTNNTTMQQLEISHKHMHTHKIFDWDVFAA